MVRFVLFALYYTNLKTKIKPFKNSWEQKNTVPRGTVL